MDGQIVFEVRADDSELATKLTEIEATLLSARSVFEGIAASAAADIAAAFGGVDLSGFQAAVNGLGTSFSGVLGSMLGLSDSTAKSIKDNFTDLLGAAFQELAQKLSGVLVPPVFSAISAFERLFDLIDRLRGKSRDDGSAEDSGVSPDLSNAPLGAIQSAFSVQNSAADLSSSVSVNLEATLVADGYQLARVAMRNLDDALASM